MGKQRRRKTDSNETSESIVRAITGEPWIAEEEMKETKMTSNPEERDKDRLKKIKKKGKTERE